MEKKRSKLGSYTSSSSGDSCDSFGQSGSVTSLTSGSHHHLFSRTLNSASTSSNSCAAQHGRGASTNAIALSAAAAATAPFNFQPILPIKISPKHRKYSLTQQSQSALAAHQPRKSSLQQTGTQQSGLPNLMQLLLGGAHTHNVFSSHHHHHHNHQNSHNTSNHNNNNIINNASNTLTKDLNNNNTILNDAQTPFSSTMPTNSNIINTSAVIPSSFTSNKGGSGVGGSRFVDNLPHRTESVISFAQDSLSISSSSGSGNQSISCCSDSYVPGRKKYSEPYLPGLLREELLGRIATCESSSSTNSSSVGYGSGNASAGSSMPSSTHFLSYLPFRRFSKRAQSDPWIAEKLQRSPYSSRRFTLGTDNFVFSDEDTRTHVVSELYDTEKSYVESLKILVNKYMSALKTGELVDCTLVDEIFYQIPEILNHHEIFLENLRQRLVNWDSKQKVGDVFVEAFTKQPIIDTYSAFINNWKNAKEAIKLASQAKPAFAKFLETMSREHKGKLTLDAILIMPVQRIPRYELLIKELIKHTSVEHPDHKPLLLAQKEIHELVLSINSMEKETALIEQGIQKVKEIESLIEGAMDLVQPDRTFVRCDLVFMPGGLGTKKERCLFLFSDLLLITSVKKKSVTNRKASTASGSPSPFGTLEGNKYKLLMKLSLESVDIAKTNDINLKKAMKDIENFQDDLSILSQINELTSNLNCTHAQLDDALKELLNAISKQLHDKQNNDAQLLSLDLCITTQDTMEHLSLLFPSTDRRAVFQTNFHQIKQQLIAKEALKRPAPQFLQAIPIRKTRAGLQFSCASATLAQNLPGQPATTPSGEYPTQPVKEVWVCNSDGYVGQVCVLSLTAEPTVTSCNGVCNARILCIAAVPAYRRKSFVTDEQFIAENIESSNLLNQPIQTMHLDAPSSNASVSRSSTNASSVYSVLSTNSSEAASQTTSTIVHNFDPQLVPPPLSSSSSSSASSSASSTTTMTPSSAANKSSKLPNQFQSDLNTSNAASSQSGSSNSTPTTANGNALTKGTNDNNNSINASLSGVADGKLKYALKSLRMTESNSLGDETNPTNTFTVTTVDESSTLGEHSLGKLAENRSGSQIRLDSESSDEDEHNVAKKDSIQCENLESYTTAVDTTTLKDNVADRRNLNLDQSSKNVQSTLKSPIDPVDPNSEFNQPTMWLGTEDGCIHVYNCNDNIRIKKNKVKVHLNSTVNSIVYLENRVFAGLQSGELAIFSRSHSGLWLTANAQLVEITKQPIIKLLAVCNRLWVAVGNELLIYQPNQMQLVNTIKVSLDSTKHIQCLVSSGLGVWLSTARSSLVRLYHAHSMQFITEVNVAPAVNKILTECNDIIRQHKAACLRVTSLLACKELLWIGTSAGALCTLQMPMISLSTTQIVNLPTINGITHGHTGHVRFLTSVQLPESQANTVSAAVAAAQSGSSIHPPPFANNSSNSLTSTYVSSDSTSMSAPNGHGAKTKTLVISGGDGYENFACNGANEGRDDSTNHLLLWNL